MTSTRRDGQTLRRSLMAALLLLSIAGCAGGATPAVEHLPGSQILVIAHPAEARARAAIQELRDTYRRLFQQESVLLIEIPARAAF